MNTSLIHNYIFFDFFWMNIQYSWRTKSGWAVFARHDEEVGEVLNNQLEHDDEVEVEHDDEVELEDDDEVEVEHDDEVELEHDDEVGSMEWFE